MARLLALDIGGKRTGIAVTDPIGIIASPLDTIETKNLISFLTNYIQIEEISTFVIGMPYTLAGNASENASNVNKISKLITEKFPLIPIKYIDERFTSSIAKDAILRGGMKKKDRQNKSNIDKISAVLILQTYMQQNNHSF